MYTHSHTLTLSLVLCLFLTWLNTATIHAQREINGFGVEVSNGLFGE